MRMLQLPTDLQPPCNKPPNRQVLRDLASFINPSSNALPAGTSTRIMRNLITAKPSTLYEAKQCPLNNCTMPTVPICPLMFRCECGWVYIML